MDTRIKQAWVDRLRQQSSLPRGPVLRVRDRFSALGHLVDLHRQVVGGRWVPAGSGRVYGYRGRSGEGLPDVLNWAGVRARDVGDLETLIRDERMRPREVAQFVEVIL